MYGVSGQGVSEWWQNVHRYRAGDDSEPGNFIGSEGFPSLAWTAPDCMTVSHTLIQYLFRGPTGIPLAMSVY